MAAKAIILKKINSDNLLKHRTCRYWPLQHHNPQYHRELIPGNHIKLKINLIFSHAETLSEIFSNLLQLLTLETPGAVNIQDCQEHASQTHLTPSA
jgi:hypothetical protein